MTRLAIFAALALAFSATALAQDGYDPSVDTQDVDTTSPVDRQANDTYEKNAVPPVPAAPLAPDRPADMRPKDISGSADLQAAQTYRANARPPVPVARHRHSAVVFRYAHHRRHRRHRHHHVAVNSAIPVPTSTGATTPPRE